MTFSKIPAFALLALSAFLASCASSAPRKDPYAQASATKRIEIDRLSQRIDSLRGRPDSASYSRQIDSLESVKSIAQASLGGLGKAVEETRKLQEEKAIRSPTIRIFTDSTSNKKYPIK